MFYIMKFSISTSGKQAHVCYGIPTYIVKMGLYKNGVCRGILFLLFLVHNISCGYSLEPPRRSGSNAVPKIYVLSKNMKKIKNFPRKSLFLQLKKTSLYIAWASFRKQCMFCFFFSSPEPKAHKVSL